MVFLGDAAVPVESIDRLLGGVVITPTFDTSITSDPDAAAGRLRLASTGTGERMTRKHEV